MYCDVCCDLFIVFFFEQKTAYEMRISDWSSDVCSSDLRGQAHELDPVFLVLHPLDELLHALAGLVDLAQHGQHGFVRPAVEGAVERVEIGRASCGERVCQYV